ncbi:MAG: hypothetical protein OEW08_07875 [Gammaproteobacteria bacterium]|nr:hypothetical protein [Gammaproteobacteria bacterium]
MTMTHNAPGHTYDGLTATLVVDAALATKEGMSLREIFRNPRELGIEPSAVGVLFHGAVHFWQVFSSNFIANLVAVEWERLVQYENAGTILAPHEALSTFYLDEPTRPFATAQLQETWARFWETWVHFDDVGQHCQALCAGPDAAIYARPYQWLLEVLEGDAAYAAWVFPALCFHAFNTAQPIEVYCRAAQRAAQSQALRTLARVVDYEGVQEGWLRHWNLLVNESVVPVLVERGDAPGSRGIEFIQNGPLRSHPIYSEYVEFLFTMQQTWRQPARTAEDAAPIATELTALRALSNDIWLAFAVPGHPWCRAVLNYFLPPPLVHARDGELASRRPANLRLRESRAGVSRVNDTYRQHAVALEARVQRFRAASRAHALGLPLDAFLM